MNWEYDDPSEERVVEENGDSALFQVSMYGEEGNNKKENEEHSSENFLPMKEIREILELGELKPRPFVAFGTKEERSRLSQLQKKLGKIGPEIFGSAVLEINPYDTTPRHILVGDVDGSYLYTFTVLMMTGFIPPNEELCEALFIALRGYHDFLSLEGMKHKNFNFRNHKDYYRDIRKKMRDLVFPLHKSFVSKGQVMKTVPHIKLSFLGDLLYDRYSPLDKNNKTDPMPMVELLTCVKQIHRDKLTLIAGNHDLLVCDGDMGTMEKVPEPVINFLTKECDFIKEINIGGEKIILSHPPLAVKSEKMWMLGYDFKDPEKMNNKFKNFLIKNPTENIRYLGAKMTGVRYNPNPKKGDNLSISTKEPFNFEGYHNIHGHDGSPFTKSRCRLCSLSSQALEHFRTLQKRGAQLGINIGLYLKESGLQRWPSILEIREESRGLYGERVDNPTMEVEILHEFRTKH